MRLLFALIGALFAVGCTSLQTAGVAEYRVEPIAVDGQVICCSVLVKNGKEAAEVRVVYQDGARRFELHERGITAFAGQRIAAEALPSLSGVIQSVVGTPAPASTPALSPSLSP